MHALLLAFCCTVTVHVHTPSGAPLSGAHVVLHGPKTYTQVTDNSGNAAFTAEGGTYNVDATASGYTGVSIDLFLRETAAVDVTLEPLDSPTLRTIGTVTVDGRLTPIRGVIPTAIVTRADMDRLGDDRVVDALMALPGATFTRPDGGSASAISVVSLRGPDPSESLIALDGQLLNDGNTGDLDLSRFPVAAFSAVDVSEGLGPEDSNGSNTFGGSINFVSLQPTVTPHFNFQESAGSFGQSELWLNATGTHDRLGYAFALDNQHMAGYTSQTVPLYSTSDPTCQPCDTHLGSSVASRAALGNMTWTFSQNANITARVFLLDDVRDQSSSVNGIDFNSFDVNTPMYGQFIGPGALSFLQNIRAYQVRSETPLGAGELTANVYESDNGVSIDGNPSNPAYDITHIDHRYFGGLNWQRNFATSQFAVGGYTDYESLAFPGQAIPTLGQTINVLYARGGFQPAERLRIDGGVFESHYTSFGANLDGRLGAIYEIDPKTSLRFSIGTGFRAPLLIERYQFPLTDLVQDVNGVFIGQGNPNEQPEHATEYELGVSHQFVASTLDFSIYQTNLRNPIEIYYPLALADSGACSALPPPGSPPGTTGNTPTTPVPGCVSYNSNVGNAVYQGIEARYVQRFAPEHLFLTAMYGLNVAYPKDLNANFSNPTSGGNLVANQQFLGIPQQQGSLELDWAEGDWHSAMQAIFRGNNNELNQGPFTFINASVGFKLNAASDVTFQGTNLFQDAAGHFTQFGAGAPYVGVDGTPLPTNRYFVEPFGFRFIFTAHLAR